MAVATVWTPELTKLKDSVGGNINQLLETFLHSGRIRNAQGSVTLAAQASGVTMGIMRVPVPFNPLRFWLLSTVSLGAATISLGNTNSAALYKAAAVFTAVDTPTPVGLTATMGVPVTTGYDSVTGSQVTVRAPGPGGGLYEDIVMVIGTAALPGAGTLRIFLEYVID